MRGVSEVRAVTWNKREPLTLSGLVVVALLMVLTFPYFIYLLFKNLYSRKP